MEIVNLDLNVDTYMQQMRIIVQKDVNRTGTNLENNASFMKDAQNFQTVDMSIKRFVNSKKNAREKFVNLFICRGIF